MNLSQLVYLCVKNVNYVDDSGFTYEAFKKHTYDDNVDYSTYIQNAFMPLNEAIARLSDLNKITYKISKANVDSDGIIDLTKDGDNTDIKVKELVGVADSNYKAVAYNNFGYNKARIENYNSNETYYIEYKEDIPYFMPDTSNYFTYVWNEEESEYTTTSVDIDIKALYGISDSMCNYIMEYVMAKMYESIEPELANMHTTRAEQYFYNIKEVRSAFAVTNIKHKYRI